MIDFTVVWCLMTQINQDTFWLKSMWLFYLYNKAKEGSCQNEAVMTVRMCLGDLCPWRAWLTNSHCGFSHNILSAFSWSICFLHPDSICAQQAAQGKPVPGRTGRPLTAACSSLVQTAEAMSVQPPFLGDSLILYSVGTSAFLDSLLLSLSP